MKNKNIKSNYIVKLKENYYDKNYEVYYIVINYVIVI